MTFSQHDATEPQRKAGDDVTAGPLAPRGALLTDAWAFQRTAAVLAILSAPLGFAGLALLLVATEFDADAVGDPTVLLAIGIDGAAQMRWGLVLNMFGYYLLLAPLILLLRTWLRPASPAFVDLYALGGLTYVLVGAIGTAILIATWPPLIADYAEATGPRREAIEAVFVGLTHAVQIGLWNILELIPGGIWWLGIGLLLRRERRITGLLTAGLGIVVLLAAVGWNAGLDDVGRGFTVAYSMLAPLWALWIGVAILRRPLVDAGAGARGEQ